MHEPGAGTMLGGLLRFFMRSSADGAEATCVVVKHTNPCGIASREDLKEAYRLAVCADPISAFGGIVAFNRRARRHSISMLHVDLQTKWRRAGRTASGSACRSPAQYVPILPGWGFACDRTLRMMRNSKISVV